MTAVDTNLLVHATSSASTEHKRAAAAITRVAATGPAVLPRQVLREYISVMTGRGFNDIPISMNEALRATREFQNMFRILEDGPAVWARLEGLAQTVRFAGKQVHDANIVATMLTHGEHRLLTFNEKHFRRFHPVIEVLTP